MFDLKTALGAIAPTLAGMIGGPFASQAVSSLEAALGLTPGAGAAGVAAVLEQGTMTGEQLAAVRAADQAHEERLRALDVDLAKANQAHEAALAVTEVDDRKDARAANSSRAQVWSIAYVVLTTFALIMAAVLYGCWALLVGGLQLKDVSTVAAVAGLVGAVVGYVAANAQTVVNFIFGGSLGGPGQHQPQAIAEAVSATITTATARK